MHIAQKVKSYSDDINVVLAEATRLGIVTQDWENESTEIDFPDGSVMIICNAYVSVYGSR